MTQDLQKFSDSRTPAESDRRNTFTNREQLISGFNDLPSNHSLDTSLSMKRDGQLSFAPMADDRLASSVMNDDLFQNAINGRDSKPSNGHHSKYERLSAQSLLDRMSESANADTRRGDLARFAEPSRNDDHSHHDDRSHFDAHLHHGEHSRHGGPASHGEWSRHGDSSRHSDRSHRGERSRHDDCGRDESGSTGDNAPLGDVQKLLSDMDGLDTAIAGNFAGAQDGGVSALTSALDLQLQMLKDPNIMQHAQLDSTILNLDKQLAGLLGRLPGGEQLMAQILQTEKQMLGAIGCGATPPVEPLPPSDQPPSYVPPSDQPPAPQPVPSPEPIPFPFPTPSPEPVPSPEPTPNPSSGTDMSSAFERGAGVTDAEYQHAIDIANALPEGMKQVLMANGGISMSVLGGFDGGAQGQNNGTYGQFYADSGMADQAEVHELYEMYGQLSNGGPGSWSDETALALADAGMRAAGDSVYYEGDLNDTVGELQGDGDHLSNAFTADFFATHPGLNHDSYGQDTLALVAQDDPTLTAYVAKAQGLVDAATV